MDHREMRSLLVRVITSMRRDLQEAFAPLTLRQRLFELAAIVAMIYLAIAVMAS